MGKREREEYEMQLFGFHSKAVHAILKSLIQEKIQSRCLKLCDSLAKKYNPEEDDLAILKKNGKKLMKAHLRGYKTQSQTLKNCIERLINIPKHVLLHEDRIQANQYTHKDLGEMQRKLENLQQKLKQAVSFGEILHEEMEMIEQFQQNRLPAAHACEVIEHEHVKCPDVTKTIDQLVRSYADLQSRFDKSSEIVLRNTRKCLMYDENSYIENSP